MSGRVNRGTGGACPMAYPGAVAPAEADAVGAVADVAGSVASAVSEPAV